MTTGELIKKWRKERKLTQKQLAEMTGISQIAIQQYEADKYKPKVDKLKKLSVALEVPLLEFADVTDEDISKMPEEDLALKKDVVTNFFYDVGQSLANAEKEEAQKKQLVETICTHLNETQYSSDELEQILEYIIFINGKRIILREDSPVDHKNKLEKIVQFLNRIINEE